MTVEMPERVAPAPGAPEVDFPWSAAATVVGALHAVGATLASQLEARPAMTATLADWRGRYRDDFDAVLVRLTATATALVESAAARAGAVVAAADEANGSQVVANRTAASPEGGMALRGTR
ncbi:MAG TPA: hypothetical protein VJM49_09110 [Acidimicrobiales bacterium]|nr:hypothetical protein [Acidimicrobiales bacterium]